MAQVEAIRRALRRQPFRPFSLKMVDGTIDTVKHLSRSPHGGRRVGLLRSRPLRG
jgi:hypothetical protein